LALLTATLACAVLFVMPASARASATQERIFQDDGQLIYASPTHMAQTLRTLAALGVDRVKVSVVWELIAPSPHSRRHPNFDATDPAKYPPGAWDRYDMLVRMAGELGLKVYFELSPPNPAWAVDHSKPTNEGPPLGHVPNLKMFAQFVKAVGRRYSGSYMAPVPAQQPSPSALGLKDGADDNSGQSDAIPRVNYWGIWNEPNERSWLNPWVQRLPNKKKATIGTEIYRSLVGAAWNGLTATGHGPHTDTILIGETANVGVLTPIPFVRDLYCVGTNSRPLTGSAAQAVGCPTSGNRRQFVSRNPGLFQSAGFAHHPYAWDTAPNRPYRLKYFVTLQNLGGFKHVLDGAFAAYGQHRNGGVQLYLTEWGFKTRPPNPFSRTTPAQQQVWLDQGEYLAWKIPWVHAIAQFLLVDAKPKSGTKKGSAAYWSTFQTGLEYANGKPKPAFFSYATPIWLPSSNHRRVTVWGEVRPAHDGGDVTAELQYQRNGSSTWTSVWQTQTSGYVVRHLSLPAAGHVRLSWRDPSSSNTQYADPSSGTVHYSRSATVS
jgi:hypothetical protein